MASAEPPPDDPSEDAVPAAVPPSRRDGAGPRVAILSLREVRPVADYGGIQEAEDALVEALAAGLYRVVLASSRFSRGALAKPGVRGLLSSSRVVRPYRVEHHQRHGEPADVLLVLARDLRDASVLVGLPGWHELGHRVAVHVERVTDRDLRRYVELVGHLRRRADALFTGGEMPPLGHLHSERLRVIEVVPPMLDVLAFPVRTDPLQRTIDVFSPDAAPPVQHQLLRQWAARNEGSYQQDIGQLGAVTSLAQHRKIYTSMATRARLFLTNHRRYTAPGLVKGAGAHLEVTTRFFEAMAAGCALVGDLPDGSRLYGEYVAPAEPVRLRLDAEELPDDVRELLEDPDASQARGQLARMAALLGNDVAHRWRRIAHHLQLPPSPGIEQRVAYLRQLVEDGEQPAAPLAADDPGPAASGVAEPEPAGLGPEFNGSSGPHTHEALDRP